MPDARFPGKRALGGRPPERAHLAPSASSAGQVVLAYLRTHAEGLKSLDPMVRRDEADAVHQMRVADASRPDPRTRPCTRRWCRRQPGTVRWWR